MKLEEQSLIFETIVVKNQTPERVRIKYLNWN